MDAGGRKSPYTIGIPAHITITDLPRTTEVQHASNLGLSQEIINIIYQRRSNVNKVIFEDMTRSTLADCSFDCVVAVEVIEHIKEDELFIKEVCRILKPAGIFLMTTPNGDHLQQFGNPWEVNPDTKRYYTGQTLQFLLSLYFREIEYAVRASKWYS